MIYQPDNNVCKEEKCRPKDEGEKMKIIFTFVIYGLQGIFLSIPHLDLISASTQPSHARWVKILILQIIKWQSGFK